MSKMLADTHRRLRLAIVGAGRMGERYARVLDEMAHVELVSIADIDESRAERLTGLYGGKAYKDHDQVFSHSLDGVIVASADNAHLEPCLKAASMQVPIMLEKPIAENYLNAKRIVDVCKQSKVKLFVAHTLRFDPRYIKVKELISENKLGEIINVHCRRWATINSGQRIKGRVSVTVFQGVHDIDVLHWLTESTVSELAAFEVRKSLKSLGVADSIVASLRFKNGAIAALEQSWVLPADVPFAVDAKLSVIGSKGMAEIDGCGSGLSIIDEDKWKTPDMAYNVSSPPIFRNEVEHFLKLICGEIQTPCISPDEALEAVRIAEAIDESASTGNMIRLE